MSYPAPSPSSSLAQVLRSTVRQNPGTGTSTIDESRRRSRHGWRWGCSSAPRDADDDAGAAEASSPRTRESASRPDRCAHHALRPSRTTPTRSRSLRRSSGDVWCGDRHRAPASGRPDLRRRLLAVSFPPAGLALDCLAYAARHRGRDSARHPVEASCSSPGDPMRSSARSSLCEESATRPSISEWRYPSE